MKYINPHQTQTIEIPADVAVCPDCKTKLTISPDGWTEEGDGYVCDSFTSWCESELDIPDEQFDQSHPSFDMPYIYWLPITAKIEKWLKDNYRFVWSDSK